jgi:hypothetical protein
MHDNVFGVAVRPIGNMRWAIVIGLLLAIVAWVPAQQPINTSQIAGTALVADPCQTAAKNYLPLSEATSSTTQIIAGTSGKHTYFCSIFMVPSAAMNVNLLSGTGTNCGTINGSVLGTNSSSGAAANGPNLAANGGFVLGSGYSAIARDNTTADSICYTSSSSSQLSGVLTYVQQ